MDWGGRSRNYRKEEDDNVREEDKQEEEEYIDGNGDGDIIY